MAKMQRTLAELHEQITEARECLCYDYAIRQNSDDTDPPAGKEQTHVLDTDGFDITDLDGDEDAKGLAAFEELYRKTCEMLNNLDSAFHDLWDCR